MQQTDAVLETAGDEAFHFIGRSVFEWTAGALRYEKIDRRGSANDVTVVTAGVDGDSSADFSVALKGLFDLKSGDFIL